MIFINKKLYIENASRVLHNKFFNDVLLTNFELKSNTNYVEELVITF